MKGLAWTFDVEVYEEYGEGHWAQARYLVHGWNDVLWTDDIEAAVQFVRESLEQCKRKAGRSDEEHLIETEQPRTPKLTPEQVKAIRWPSAETFLQLPREQRIAMSTEQEWKWAICYALKDLMPEEKNIAKEEHTVEARMIGKAKHQCEFCGEAIATVFAPNLQKWACPECWQPSVQKEEHPGSWLIGADDLEERFLGLPVMTVMPEALIGARNYMRLLKRERDEWKAKHFDMVERFEETCRRVWKKDQESESGQMKIRRYLYILRPIKYAQT